MFEKFYVQVPAGVVEIAAKQFLEYSEYFVDSMASSVFTDLMNFCTECVLISENQLHSDPFTMTNTQAVWVYNWNDRAKVAKMVAEARIPVRSTI